MTLQVPFLSAKKIPDPTEIFFTTDWYFLDHISSSLVKWDPETNSYTGVIAESWERVGNTLTFHLKKNAFFSDGSAITSKDVAYSLKRILLKRNNSHFKPWDQLEACDSLNGLSDECTSIQTPDNFTIQFRLKYLSQSFFLLWASPEGGIWKHSDLNLDSFEPTTFSGPYLPVLGSKTIESLERNRKWVEDGTFSKRPDRLQLFQGDQTELSNAIKEGRIDVSIDSFNPFRLHDYNSREFEVLESAFNIIYYLRKTSENRAELTKEILKNLWDKKPPSYLMPAFTFFPFPDLSGVRKDEFLEKFPQRGKGKPRIGYYKSYFTKEFMEFLFDDRAELVGITKEEWFKPELRKGNNVECDYILSAYVATDKSALVQFNYLAGAERLPYSLNDLDNINMIHNKSELIEKIQSWLLTNQKIVPLMFGKSYIAYRRGLNVGNQPLIDSELQLWRITSD